VNSSFVPYQARLVPSLTLRALAFTGASGSVGIFGISIFGIEIFGILIQLHGDGEGVGVMSDVVWPTVVCGAIWPAAIRGAPMKRIIPTTHEQCAAFMVEAPRILALPNWNGD
jgi:hypothetical protein